MSSVAGRGIPDGCAFHAVGELVDGLQTHFTLWLDTTGKHDPAGFFSGANECSAHLPAHVGARMNPDLAYAAAAATTANGNALASKAFHGAEHVLVLRAGVALISVEQMDQVLGCHCLLRVAGAYPVY